MTREHPYTNQQNVASFQPRSPLRQPFTSNAWNQPTSHSTSTSQWTSAENDITEVQGNSLLSGRTSGQSFNTDLTSPLLSESGQLVQITGSDPSFQASNSTDQTGNVAWDGGRAVAAGFGFIEPGMGLAEKAATRIDQFRTARLENRVGAIADGIVRRLETAPDLLDLTTRVDAARKQYPGIRTQSWREFVSNQTDPQVRGVLSQFPERERIRRIEALQELRKAIGEGSPLRGSRTRRLFSELIRGTRPASTRTFREGAIALAEGNTRPFRSGVLTDPNLVWRGLGISRLTGFQPEPRMEDRTIRNRGFWSRVFRVGHHDTHAEGKAFLSRLLRPPELVAASEAVCRPSPSLGGCGQNTQGIATLTRRDRFIVAPGGRNRLHQRVPARFEHYRADGRMRTIPLSTLLSMTPQQRSVYARTSAEESIGNRRAESWSRRVSERLRDRRSQGGGFFRRNSGGQPPQPPGAGSPQSQPPSPNRPGGGSGSQSPQSRGPGGTQQRPTNPPRSSGGNSGAQTSQAPRGSSPRRAAGSGTGHTRPPRSGGSAPASPPRRPSTPPQPRAATRPSSTGGSSPRIGSGGAGAAMRGVRRLGLVGQVAGLGMDAWDIKKAVDRDGGRFGTNAKQTTTKVAGGLAGGAAGAAAGAAIGAAFGGVGAVPGAAIGFALGTAGSYFGSKGGEKLGKKLFK